MSGTPVRVPGRQQLGLALACDIVVAAEHASFGTPEVKVGLFPMMISAIILRNVPRKKAMEMLLTGEPVSAATARDIGLINRVVTAGTERDAELVEVFPPLRHHEARGAVRTAHRSHARIAAFLGVRIPFRRADVPPFAIGANN